MRPLRTFTLLELLLVVFLLAAVAGLASSLGTEVDQQSRYEDTRVRRERIRAAILGQAGATSAGVDGFVADMGRLPLDLRELVEGPLDPDLAWRPYSATEQLPPGTLDSLGQAPRGVSQGAGWRGPYLRGELEHDASGEFLAYRDGWKQSSGRSDPDYGWVFYTSSGALGQDSNLYSLGADGAPDSSPLSGAFSYRWDQPQESEGRLLVASRDYLLPLGDLIVRVRNRSGGPVDLSQVAVAILSPSAPPRGATGGVTWTLQTSAALGVAGDTLDPGELSAQRGPLRHTASAGGGALDPLPWGRRSLVLVRAADPPSDPPVLLGPLASQAFLPRASLAELTLDLDAAP